MGLRPYKSIKPGRNGDRRPSRATTLKKNIYIKPQECLRRGDFGQSENEVTARDF